MTRSELIKRLNDKNPHLYAQDCERIVQAMFDAITNSLAQGHRVELRGFGAFFTKIRKPRNGRNPRTGQSVFVPEKRVPFFRTGKQLHDDLNATPTAL